MTRGGKRDKAGRKSTWISGCKFEDTKLIRVPSAIADRLMEIAHKLDAGESVELVTNPKTKVSNTKKINVPVIKQGTLPLGGQIACPNCGSISLSKDGHKNGVQRYVCKTCKRKFLETTAARILDLETKSIDSQ